MLDLAQEHKLYEVLGPLVDEVDRKMPGISATGLSRVFSLMNPVSAEYGGRSWRINTDVLPGVEDFTYPRSVLSDAIEIAKIETDVPPLPAKDAVAKYFPILHP